MLLRQRNRNQYVYPQCPGGRNCCSLDNGKESKIMRRTVRRVEKQQWRKAVKNGTV